MVYKAKVNDVVNLLEHWYNVHDDVLDEKSHILIMMHDGTILNIEHNRINVNGPNGWYWFYDIEVDFETTHNDSEDWSMLHIVNVKSHPQYIIHGLKFKNIDVINVIDNQNKWHRLYYNQILYEETF